MKKLLLSTTMLATLALAGCATNGTNMGNGTAMGTASDIGMSVLKGAIDNQCRIEIQKQPAWRVASVVMSSDQKEAVQSKVCGCVSEQAPQQVTLVELGNAAIDTQYRAKLVTRVVAKTLQSCYSSITK
ncbi:hypothetical protein [Psychrobacter sp. 16-MNA-CIBAN-0192]|uniref:hypothetical protein n=1 Tax=Psychrobacter sp. 16-MNA-CIBAN-0192 TaxID=3140448 RepID=UPI00332F5E38